MPIKLFSLCLAACLVTFACNPTPTTEPTSPSKQNKQLTKILAEKFADDDYRLCQFIDSIHASLDGQTDSIFTYVTGIVYHRRVFIWWRNGSKNETQYYKVAFQNLKDTAIEIFTLSRKETDSIDKKISFADLLNAKSHLSDTLKPMVGIAHVTIPHYFIFNFKDSLEIFEFQSDQLAMNEHHAAHRLVYSLPPGKLLFNPSTD
jgi:hypothetical protein